MARLDPGGEAAQNRGDAGETKVEEDLRRTGA
jgi:hypothetical protein